MQGGYYANYEQVAQVLQQQWRGIGINVKIEIRNNFQEVTANPKHMFAHSNGLQMPDITHPVENIYGPQGIRARKDAPGFSWTPPARFEELLGLLDTTLDHEQRMVYFKQVLDVMDEERPEIPLFMALEYYGIRNGIEWKPYAFWPMDFGPDNLSFE
jgi:peptide/nickel transport system substrate-binding protein